MADRYRLASATAAALTLNALRPVTRTPAVLPSFFAGWLTAELAPHALALTAAGSGAHLARHGVRDADKLGLALSAATAAGLGALLVQGQRTREVVDDALQRALGADYAQRLDPPPTAADLATPWRQLVMPFWMRDAEVERVRNIAYAKGGRRVRLDVYTRRDRPSGAPVLLQIHGGGWVIGRKDQQGIPLMLHLAARGWVCVAANYRLSPKATFPDHLIDVKRALAWIRENGRDYGADPSFVAVTGGSAGGHLAALTALTPNDPEYQPGFEHVDTTVQACVPHYGVYDVLNETGHYMLQGLTESLLKPIVMKRDPVLEREAYEKASPLCRIRPDAPPFFVIHGHSDSLLPVEQARLFVERLRAVAQNPVVYAELPGAQHAFDIFPSIRSAHVVRAVERFLRAVRLRVPIHDASAA